MIGNCCVLISELSSVLLMLVFIYKVGLPYKFRNLISMSYFHHSFLSIEILDIKYNEKIICINAYYYIHYIVFLFIIFIIKVDIFCNYLWEIRNQLKHGLIELYSIFGKFLTFNYLPGQFTFYSKTIAIRHLLYKCFVREISH